MVQSYRQMIDQYNIKKKKNIPNFDEAGFRIGCPKGQSILIPADIQVVSFSCHVEVNR